MDKPPIRHVMFDYGNVLMHYRTSEFFDELAKYSNYRIHPREILFGIWSGRFVQLELGEITLENFFEYISKQLSLGVDYTFEKFKDLFARVVSPDLEMVRIKDALNSNGICLILVTNNNEFHMQLTRDAYPEVLSGFKFSMISSVEGFRKPHVEMFYKPLKYFNIKPRECLLIDDKDENLLAFRNMGGVGYKYNASDGSGNVDDSLLVPERESLVRELMRLGLLNNFTL